MLTMPAAPVFPHTGDAQFDQSLSGLAPNALDSVDAKPVSDCWRGRRIQRLEPARALALT
jgi:hypothetical protein